MKTLVVETAPSYNVHIGSGVYRLFGSTYREQLEKADRIAVVADSQAASLHIGRLMAELTDYEVHVLEVPAGEEAKTAESFMAIQTFLLENSFSRKSVLLAFGGGATGDVAGFAASTFMRGIPFFQCPTTILAHDSAVGGKTAINHPSGKNMIGTFYQPKAVLYDTDTLATLPPEEVRSGMAEVIKHAFISNGDWLYTLLKIRELAEMSQNDLADHLEKGIAVKAAIVEEDEFEGGVRKFLNFGHTLAHAVEARMGFGTVTHGEAVALGISYDLLLTDHPVLSQYLDWCKANRYPLELLKEIPFEELLPFMKKDKKSSAGELVFIVLEEIGMPAVKVVDEEEAREVYKELQKKLEEMLQ